MWGGNANNGALCGLVYANANNVFSNANANIGARLEFIIKNLKALPPLKYCGEAKHLVKRGRPYGICVSRFSEYAETTTKKAKEMPKRIGYIFDKICSLENLIEADKEARKNKKHGGKYPYGIRVFDKENIENSLLIKLQHLLISETYVNQPYKVELRKTDKKWRELYKCNYYPTHIVHHAVMRVISPYLIARMTKHSYAGIEGKGTTQAANALKEYLKDKRSTKFYLQEDVCKFYPTIDQDVTMKIINRIFKDPRFLRLMNKLIHHTPVGLQIGFYISQLVANYIYTIVDRVITEKMGAKYYVRFCDDMVILHSDKYFLMKVHEKIKNTVETVFNQKLHNDYVISRIGYEVKDETNNRKRKRGSKGAKHQLSGI